MGLTTFSGDKPTLQEALIAKNYLDERELRLLTTDRDTEIISCRRNCPKISSIKRLSDGAHFTYRVKKTIFM